MTDNAKEELQNSTALQNGEGIFEIGDKVEKLKGYKLPGVIVSKFHTLSGKIRYVVECEVPEVAGLLHIYSDKDLSIRIDD